MKGAHYMADMAIQLPEKQVRIITCDTIDKLIALGNGEVALLYLYLLRHENNTNSETAAQELHFSQEQLEQAFFTLRNINLSAGRETKVTATPAKKIEKAPQYKPEELNKARHDDPEFATVCQVAESQFGKILKLTQMRCLFQAYDYFGLNAETLIELLAYLKKERETVTTVHIRNEAADWAEMRITSAQDAQNYILYLKGTHPLRETIYQIFGIVPQNASLTEKKICIFVQIHDFSEELVTYAVKLAVKKTGEKNIKYIWGILKNWEDKGIHTMEMLTALEQEPHTSPRQTSSSAETIWDSHYSISPEDKAHLNRVKAYQATTHPTQPRVNIVRQSGGSVSSQVSSEMDTWDSHYSSSPEDQEYLARVRAYIKKSEES